MDPILARLQGEEGAKVSFEDILEGYNRIEQDYKIRATGAKDVCAAVFFEFHPVKITFFFVHRNYKIKHKLVLAVICGIQTSLNTYMY